MARTVTSHRKCIVLLYSYGEGDCPFTDVGSTDYEGEFETQEMKNRVAVYHESLNKHIDTASEYSNEETGDDFVEDDEAVPIGYQDDGDYSGPSDAPDIDDVIDYENKRTQSDSYDKYIGAEIILPNSADQSLMARVKRKKGRVTETIPTITILYGTIADMRWSSQTAVPTKLRQMLFLNPWWRSAILTMWSNKYYKLILSIMNCNNDYRFLNSDYR